MATQKNIFGVNRRVGDAWKIDGAVITFNIPGLEEDKSKLIVSGLSLRYGRSAQTITPLNSDVTHTLVGDSAGEGAMDLIIGPDNVIKSFIESFSDICDFKEKNINIFPTGPTYACDKKESNKLSLYVGGVLINNFSMDVRQAQGPTIVTCRAAFSFLTLNFNDPEASTNPEVVPA